MLQLLGGIVVVGGKLQAEMFGEYNVESVAYKSFVTRDYLFRISNERMAQVIRLVILTLLF